MSNVVKCPKCGRTLISEETSSHKCALQIGNVTRIVDLICEWWVNSDLPEYGKVLIVKATDGTLYRITSSPDVGHPKKYPEDGTVYNFAHSRRAHDIGSNSAEWLRPLSILADDWD